MKYLLDTHVFLWLATKPSRLSGKVRLILENDDSLLFLSAASGWEIAIKYALGKLPLSEPPDEFVTTQANASRISQLDISMQHALATYHLPAIHKDPFDRIIAAQAKHEEMTIVSDDQIFKAYGSNVVRAS